MLEILEGIIKGLGILLRVTVESGTLLDISLSGTGRFFITLFYPPHWNKKVTYNHSVEIITGIIIWALLSYGTYYLYNAL